jgi:hypothetical protein
VELALELIKQAPDPSTFFPFGPIKLICGQGEAISMDKVRRQGIAPACVLHAMRE